MAAAAKAIADTAGFTASSCADPRVGRILRGTYAATLTKHHGKMVYRKSELVDGLHVLVYFCDEPDFVGWWIAPSLGDDNVWAFSPGSEHRPSAGGWRVPWDGDADETFRLTAQPDVLPVAGCPEPPVQAIESSEEEEEVENCAATADPYGGELSEPPAASSTMMELPASENAAESLQREIREVEAQLAAREQSGAVTAAKAPPPELIHASSAKKAFPKGQPSLAGQMATDEALARPHMGQRLKPTRAATPIAVVAAPAASTSTPSAPSRLPQRPSTLQAPPQALRMGSERQPAASTQNHVKDPLKAAPSRAVLLVKRNSIASVPSSKASVAKFHPPAVPPSAATKATSKAPVAKFHAKHPPSRASVSDSALAPAASSYRKLPPPPRPPMRPAAGGQGPHPPRTPPLADWQKGPVNVVAARQMAGRIGTTASDGYAGNASWHQHQQQHTRTGNEHKGAAIPAWSAPTGDRRGEDQKRKAIPAWNNGGEHGGGKRQRSDDEPIVGVDAEGRPYNLHTVVVNFANVGAFYAKKVLKRTPESGGQMLFDWEGVRRCVTYLTNKLGLKVVGVIFENFWATDNHSHNKQQIPDDIRWSCESVEETPRIVGRNHSSADDEMTIKCAYHRNCRFMDNDNYRDWKQQLRDEGCRAWLERCQDLLHMRYYFDSSIGVFETLDGNVPPGLLAPNGTKIPAAISKRDLWTAPNR